MNGNTLWMDAINVEMENMKVSFDKIDGGFKIAVGCNKSSRHLAFDVPMTLKWKDSWIKDGHNTPDPE